MELENESDFQRNFLTILVYPLLSFPYVITFVQCYFCVFTGDCRGTVLIELTKKEGCGLGLVVSGNVIVTLFIFFTESRSMFLSCLTKTDASIAIFEGASGGLVLIVVSTTGSSQILVLVSLFQQ